MYKFICAVVLFSAMSNSAFAADRTLVAEGIYVAHTKTGTKPFDQWKLWQATSGQLTAEVSMSIAPSAGAISLKQSFVFDEQFVPTGYNLATEMDGEKVDVQCLRENGTLACESLFQGSTNKATTKVSGPCVVMVSEFTVADLPWLMINMIRVVQSGKSEEIPTYILDEATEGQFTLTKDATPTRLKLIGEETADVLGHKQTVRTYEMEGSEPWVIKSLTNGLILSLSVKNQPGGGFELSDYTEYKPWSPK